MKKHWLYGECNFKVEVEEDMDCVRCFHVMVCNKDQEKRCSNFKFGCSSNHGGCQSCSHKFTRYDKDKIPCFHCKDFLNKNRVNVDEDDI